MSAVNNQRIWSTGFTIIFVINVIINFAQYMMITLVPKFAESLGASAVVIGVVTGTFAITALAVRPLVGPATLRLRSQWLLAGTLLILMTAFILYSSASSVMGLFMARLLHGTGMGFLAPVTLSLASQALPAERMAQGIGVFSLGQAVATAVGPSTGLWLLGVVGYRGTFLTSGGLIVIAFLMTWALSPAPPPTRTGGTSFSWRSVIAPEAVVPAIVIFFLAGAYSGINAFIVLLGESVGVADIGMFFTAYALAIVISRPLAGRISDRHGLAVVIVPGMAVFGLAFVVVSQAHSLAMFLVAGVLSALGYGICQPAVQTWCLISVEPARRGIASNTNYIGVDLAYLVMPVVAGAIVSWLRDAGASVASSYQIMYLSLIVPVAIGMAVFLVYGRRSLSHQINNPNDRRSS
ncbi:Predicted arabinose efflux permease, MFS family [Actinomyces ruminicola]|uniref:Predicted arabinose efflux permease, MFS family n=1 Tax=Actinomyces ruminicola TaxID=332524 RepID=A0A1H0B924_9ACTO|nr:MFS transporter [Actinomyces ruminicola]SDN42146.1 Predicted arabinose efflux permease, MFS family [Actinomyces ruminicola]